MTLEQEEMVGSREHAILHDLAACGHYIHVHQGGRAGQEPIIGFMRLEGGTVTQGALAEHFELASGSISEVLSKLEREGLCIREKDDSDRRKVVVRLTPEGCRRADSYIEERREFEETGFACLSDAERDELLRLLDKVVAQWEEVRCPER